MKTLLLFLCAITLIACSKTTAPVEDPFDADHSAITDPKARWEAYEADDYVISQFIGCYCIERGPWYLTYTNGVLADVKDSVTNATIKPSDWPTSTVSIPELFVRADSTTYTTKPHILRVTYDLRYGYPTDIYIDYEESTADDEFHFTTRLVR